MNTALVIALVFCCVFVVSTSSAKKQICAQNELGETKTFCNLSAMLKFNSANSADYHVVMADGDCGAFELSSCSDKCTDNDPICGKNTVTGDLKDFTSDCQRRTQNCLTRPGFDFDHYGTC